MKCSWGVVVVFLSLFVLSACSFFTGAPAPITSQTISPSGGGYNGRTYEQNYNDILAKATNTAVFNTSQIITTGSTYCNATAPCYWVPWFDSSTDCNISHLKTATEVSTPNWTFNTMVTDEFSEQGVVLAAANSSFATKFDQWVNTLTVITRLCSLGPSGNIACWYMYRGDVGGVANVTRLGNNDSASDATWRNAMALYIASTNNNFTDANRTRYLTMANAIMADSIAVEFKKECYPTKNWGTVCWWPYAGANARTTGIARTNTEPSMYLGYYPDVLTALLYYRVQSQNDSIDSVLNNVTLSFLVAANYTGGNTSSAFRMAPYRWAWNFTSTTDTNVTISMPSADSYYWTAGNPNTDTADGVRIGHLCRNVKLYNDSGRPLTGPLYNLSQWCVAQSNTNVFTSTTSCQQYNWSNGCKVGPYDGFKLNGMFIAFHTYLNTSMFQNKLDNIFATHTYSWTGAGTFDSTSCGNGMTYDSVRATKALLWGMAYDQPPTFYNGTIATGGTSGGAPLYFTGPINLTLISPLNGTSSNTSLVNFSVQTWALNETCTLVTTNGSLPHLFAAPNLCSGDPGFSGGTYSLATCSQNWTSGNLISPNLSMESNYSQGEFSLYINISYSGGTNNKFRPTNICVGGLGTTTNKFNFENNSATQFHIKADRGGFSSTGNYNYNTSIIVNFTTNFTNNVSRACVGTDCTNWESFARDAGQEDCFAFEPGTTSSANTQFFNYTLYETKTPYVNYSSATCDGHNITFYLANGTFLGGFVNVTNGSISSNVSSLPIGNYTWFAYVVTPGNNTLNATPMSFAVINGTSAPVNTGSTTAPTLIELGTIVWVNATAGSSFCIDVNASDYGVNSSCTGSTAINLSLNITSFLRNAMNDSQTFKNLSYNQSTASNQTIYVEVNHKDKVVGLSVNIKGYSTNGTFPSNVKIYVNNTLSNSIGVLLNTTTGSLSVFNDSTTNKTAQYPTPATQVFGYLRLPKNANVTNTYFVINGSSGFTYAASNTWLNRTVQGGTAGQSVFVNYSIPTSRSLNNFFQIANNIPAVYSNNSIPSQCIVNAPAGGTQLFLRIDSSVTYATYVTCFNGSDYPYVFSSFHAGGCAGSGCAGSGSSSLNAIMDNNYATRAVGGATSSGSWFDYSGFGYENGVIYDFGMYWDIAPSNPWLEAGTITGTRDWNYSSVLNVSVVSGNFSAKINNYLASCTADAEGFCNMPLYVYGSGGNISISEFQVNYSYYVNPVQLSVNTTQAFVNRTSGIGYVPITFQNEVNGTIEVTNISYRYIGGNSTIAVVTHFYNNTVINTTNIVAVASQWNYSLPTNIRALEFIPSSPFSQNVSPYGQTLTRPILNITNTGYGWNQFNFSVYVNSTYSCVNLTVAGVGNASQAVQSNGTWTYLIGGLAPNQSGGVWLFANYNCNVTGWRSWRPKLSFRACANGTQCSEER